MKIKAAAAATLILLVATIALPTLTQKAEAESDKSSAYAVNAILGKALINVQTLVAQERGSEAYDELNKRLEDARKLAETAQRELKEGEYQRALSDSMRALTTLTSVAAELNEDAGEQIVAAKHSTLRISSLLNVVKNLTEAASAKGYDVSAVKLRLEAAKRLVEEAQTLSAKRDALGAGKKVAESKSTLSHIVSALSQVYGEEKVEIVEGYVNKTLNRIYGVEGVEGRFTELIKEINSSKKHLQAGRLRPALKNISEAMKQMEKMVNDDLKKVNEELNSLKKQINDLKAKGVNVEGLERFLQEATETVKQASTHLEKGDYITARIRLAQLESALHRLR